MREIKFRAWDTKRKEWKSRLNVYVNGYGEKIWQFGNDFEVYGEVELSQYTGLKDKNGVEIYEGDIMLSHNSAVMGSVFYQAPSFVIKKNKRAKSWYTFILSPEQNQFEEIAGNIYENPELLK